MLFTAVVYLYIYYGMCGRNINVPRYMPYSKSLHMKARRIVLLLFSRIHSCDDRIHCYSGGYSIAFPECITIHSFFIKSYIIDLS